MINVLSLFDGMGCGRIALEKEGISVNNYFASEIDKYAMKVSATNYPDIKQLGSVVGVSTGKLPKIDLLLGGSPCQGFSFAGKQLNFNDPRSKLFFEYVRVLRELRIHNNPDIKFLLENVKMKKEYQDVISEALGVKPIEINSALMSAQNRKRLYWTNIEGVIQPNDKNILLKDILQDGVVDRDKSYCIDANYWKGGNPEQYFNKSRRQLVFKDEDAIKIAYGAAIRGRNIVNGKRKDYLGAPTIQRIEINNQEKSNCLTTVAKDSMVLIIPEATKKGFIEVSDGECFDWTFPNSKTRRGRKMNNKSNCLTAANYDFMQYKDGLVRKFTPIECERLQTVPDNYTSIVSNSQRYRMLGNGWNVDTICHILSFLKKDLEI